MVHTNREFPYNLISSICSLGNSSDTVRPNKQRERIYRKNPFVEYDLLCLMHCILKKDIYVKVLICRFAEDMTLQQIGELYGLTRERVRQLIEHSVKSLWLYKNTDKILSEGFNPFFRLEIDKVFREAYHRGYDAGYVEGYHRDNAAPDELKYLPLEELGLSVRLVNCLARAGIKTFGELAGADANKVSTIRGLGTKTLIELINFFEKHGVDASQYRKIVVGVKV